MFRSILTALIASAGLVALGAVPLMAQEQPAAPAAGEQQAGAAAPATVLTDADAVKQDEVPFAPARVRVGCKVKSPAWTGEQAGGGLLLKANFPACSFTQEPGRAARLLVRAEIELNPDADIRKCASFSAAFLFHIGLDRNATKAPGLDWAGAYSVEDQLSISNLYGQTLSFDYVPVYDPSQPADADKPLSWHLFPTRATPSFDQYFVGDIEILSEDGSSGLSRELFRAAPVTSQVKAGAFDLDVALDVETFRPEGWCYAADAKGLLVEPPLRLRFSEAAK